MINLGKNYYQLAGQAYNRATKHMQNLTKNAAKLTNLDNISITGQENSKIPTEQDNNTKFSRSEIANGLNNASPSFAATLTNSAKNFAQSNFATPWLGRERMPKTAGGTTAENNQEVSNNAIFPKILRRKIDQLRGAEAYAMAESKGNASLVQVVKRINEAELQLTQVMSIRDKIVNSLLEIFKMPL